MTKLPTRPTFRNEPELLRKSIAQKDTSVAKALAARPWDPAALRGAMITALDNAARRASLDVGDPAIAVDLERAACMGAGLFAALAAGPGRTVEAPQPGGSERVNVTGAAPDPTLADPAVWRDALLAAFAVRAPLARTLLAEVPVALLRGLAPARPDWFFLECEALQALALRHRDAPERLVAAARAADPSTVDELGRDWVADVVTPELQLAFRGLDRDQAGFDTWMSVAIKGHHHYYQAREERQKQPLSQLALAPLAMACVAHDLGIRTNVTSDYLPRHIIER